MGSPSPSLISSTMHTFVLLSIVSLAFAAPMPEGEEAPAAVEAEAPAALPYVHDATGDVAEAYVHEEIPAVEAVAEEEIAAEPYVHEEIAAEAYVHDATGDVAEEYVHVEPVVPAVAPVAPAVTYAAYPYAGVYAGHAVAYPYAVYHTGCVNNVGSIVPCA